jgi:predicted nucleic acid-binding protein
MASAATDKWVVNASPLICLGKIKRLEWLTLLTREIVIPAGVAIEIREGPANDRARQWLETAGAAFVREVGDVDPSVSSWDLGSGESEVLGWAQAHPGFTTVLDDRAARRCADVLDLPLCGTLGIALQAKLKGLEPRLVPLLDELVKAGLHVSTAIHGNSVKAELRR